VSDSFHLPFVIVLNTMGMAHLKITKGAKNQVTLRSGQFSQKQTQIIF